MSQPIRIAVTGTHSTGKTTLVRRLEMELRDQGVTVARTGGSIAQAAADRGFPKMRAQTAATTEWIIATGVAAELEAGLHADVVLVDRSVIDPLAYWLAALEYRGETPAAADEAHLGRVVFAHLRGYHLLLATRLDRAVPRGEHRDRDLTYRAMVADHITRLLADVPDSTPWQVVENTEASHQDAIRAVLETASHLVPA